MNCHTDQRKLQETFTKLWREKQTSDAIQWACSYWSGSRENCPMTLTGWWALSHSYNLGKGFKRYHWLFAVDFSSQSHKPRSEAISLNLPPKRRQIEDRLEGCKLPYVFTLYVINCNSITDLGESPTTSNVHTDNNTHPNLINTK